MYVDQLYNSNSEQEHLCAEFCHTSLLSRVYLFLQVDWQFLTANGHFCSDRNFAASRIQVMKQIWQDSGVYVRIFLYRIEA